MRYLFTAVLSVFLLMPSTASAQDVGTVLRLMADCEADAIDFCHDIRPGGGRVAACLYANRDRLSPRCRRAVRIGAAMRACAGDAARLCAGIRPGQGRIAACLRGARRDLSPRCEAVIAFGGPAQRSAPTWREPSWEEDTRRESWQDDEDAAPWGYDEDPEPRSYGDGGDKLK